MIDLHFDLLSIIYNCYLKDDYSYLEELIKSFNNDNVSGLLANLYFMNEEEMKNEIGDININVVEMFEIATNLFKKYLPNTNVIFSIEGCDYINDIYELEKLYELGLRNILLVWNNPNKYGSGNRGDYGLTEEGKEFLIKAIDLGISIDMSHMNKKTFYDTVNLIKEQKKLGKNVKVIASHSNCSSIYSHERNLDDDQIKALSSVDGLLGLVSYTNFVGNDNFKELYLNHIDKAISILGIDNVGVSSDDMVFANVLFNENYKMIFDYKTINNDIRKLLSNNYSDEEIDKIMYKNIYDKLF